MALVADVVTNGFRQPFVEGRSAPPRRQTPPSMANDRRKLLAEYTSALLEKAAVEPVPERERASHSISPIVFVPKRSGLKGEWRPCLDGREQNAQQAVEHFTQDGVQDIFPLLQRGMYAVSVDLADAYLQVPMHAADRPRLAFWGRRAGMWQAFRFRAMPFGIRHASRLLAKLLRNVQARFHEEGMVCLFYQDDWIFLSMDPVVLAAQLAFVFDFCGALNLRFQMRKCHTEPSTVFEWLGLLFDTNDMTVRLSPDRLERFTDKLDRMAGLKEASARQIASVIGTVESCSVVSLQAFLKRRALMRLKQTALRENGWNGRAVVTAEACEELQWWRQQAQAGNLVRHITLFSPQMVVEMDAGPRRWGAYIIPVHARPASTAACYPITHILPTMVEDRVRARGADWHESPQQVCVSQRPSRVTAQILETTGHWTAEQATLHISVREGIAVEKAFRSFLPTFRALTTPDADGMVDVLVRTDNVNVQSYINKAGGVRNVRLAAQTEHFLGEALADGFHLRASRLTSKQNVAADRLSRLPCDVQDWKLHPAIFDLIEQWVGTRFDVDAFATELNHQVVVFFSRFPQPGSAGVDALLQDWTRFHNLFLNPPFLDYIVLAVLEKLGREKIEEATLVLPLWPARPWWPLLVSMLADHPLVIPADLPVFLPQSRANATALPQDRRRWATGVFRCSTTRCWSRERLLAPPQPSSTMRVRELAQGVRFPTGEAGKHSFSVVRTCGLYAHQMSPSSHHGLATCWKKG